ncbi:hypothetical protein [Sporosarcina aquimarina]|uniref:SHOCT domain-containing protein n=1 Tax=Sporosarcina aquimarina TaxID=114975 RepID=A0ABU4FVM9_9BACL|nr:hypothetical protein [Sporosarcina aquimarina]MDW0108759.1 hypothetical protein [Sporosarcina aquimarina]
MSWSVLGIFVLFVTWGFTKSISLGFVILLGCCALYIAFGFIKNYSKRLNQPKYIRQTPRQEFLSKEWKRLENLRKSGLLTEDEFTVQSRLLTYND